MGEPFHPGEGRAALEVDEDEVQLIGAVVMGEAGDDRPQQLTLKRTWVVGTIWGQISSARGIRGMFSLKT
jgi:hypothetical protein